MEEWECQAIICFSLENWKWGWDPGTEGGFQSLKQHWLFSEGHYCIYYFLLCSYRIWLFILFFHFIYFLICFWAGRASSFYYILVWRWCLKAFCLAFCQLDILYSYKHRNTIFLEEYNSLWEIHSSCNPFRCSQYLTTGKSVMLKRDCLSYSWLCSIFSILLLLHLKVNWGGKIKIVRCRFMCWMYLKFMLEHYGGERTRHSSDINIDYLFKYFFFPFICEIKLVLPEKYSEMCPSMKSQNR